MERLREFRAKVQLERSAVEATAGNRASYESSIRKVRNHFEWDGIFLRIPGGPLTDDLARDLRTALGQLGVLAVDVRANERAISRRKLPETIPEGEPWRFEDDDIRGVIDVRVTGEGVGGELSRKVLDLFHRFTRLLSIGSYSDTSGHLDASLSAVYFLPIVAPRMIPHARDAEADLRAAGIDPSQVASTDEGKSLVAAVRAEFDAMKKVESKYLEAVALTNEVQLWTAKLRFFKGLAGVSSKRGDIKDAQKK